MTKTYTLRCDRCGHKYVYIVSGVPDETGMKIAKPKKVKQFGTPFHSLGGGYVECPFCHIETPANSITKIEYKKDVV